MSRPVTRKTTTDNPRKLQEQHQHLLQAAKLTAGHRQGKPAQPTSPASPKPNVDTHETPQENTAPLTPPPSPHSNNDTPAENTGESTIQEELQVNHVSDNSDGEEYIDADTMSVEDKIKAYLLL